jgi:hypothetical protein
MLAYDVIQMFRKQFLNPWNLEAGLTLWFAVEGNCVIDPEGMF